MMGYRFDEGRCPHHINADLYDDVVGGDDNLGTWIVAGAIVFLLAFASFFGLVAWFLTRG